MASVLVESVGDYLLIEKEKIWEAKQKLGDEAWDIMMAELGVDDYDDKNLKCCCPFHEEDTPSFIWNPKELSGHCFGSCARNYDLIDIWMAKGYTYLQAVQKLFDITETHYAFGEKNVETERNYRYPHEEPVNDKKTVYSYLQARGISKETVDYLDIREDSHGNVVFNYYDTNDVLTMVKYRPSRKIKHGEPKNWCQKDADTSPILFNMHKINTTKPLLICSGELDCAAAIECGWKNAVSIPLGDGNLHWVDKCFEWLEQFDEIIVCSDNDDSGRKFRNTVVPMLGGWRCRVVELPEEKDGKHIKDLNECLYFYGKEATLNYLLDAKMIENPSIEDLSDVSDVDLSMMDGIRIGISGVDKALMKIFFGTLTLITGQPGSGKTSFIDQIACQAMEQGENVFIYSKELPNHMTKDWMNYILAGNRNVNAYEDSAGSTYYKVPNDVKKSINDEYRNRWFVYRDDASIKFEDIMETATVAVRRHAVRFLILDNLMMMDIGADEHSELKKQTEVINNLITFATKYNVAILLVTHPKKIDTSMPVNIYGISGSSNIVNLAHRAFGLRRVTDDEREGQKRKDGSGWVKEPVKYDVMFHVIKDRLRGRSGYKEGMYYDIPSRRFYTTPEEYDYQYSWDKNEYEDELSYPPYAMENEVYGDE